MAFNFETELVESISNRCCNLRNNSSFNQDDIAENIVQVIILYPIQF